MKKTLAITAAALIAVGSLTACTSGTDTPSATAPTAVAPLDRQEDTSSIKQDAIQFAWDGMSYNDQAVVCDYYVAYPHAAFAAFNEGAGGLFLESDFTAFFDAHC